MYVIAVMNPKHELPVFAVALDSRLCIPVSRHLGSESVEDLSPCLRSFTLEVPVVVVGEGSIAGMVKCRTHAQKKD